MRPLRRPRTGPLRPGAEWRPSPEVRHKIRRHHPVVISCYPHLQMDQEQLRGLFEAVRSGEVDIDSALDRVRHLPFEDLGYAKLDHHRALRHGLTEVIFGKGKTPQQVKGIAERLLDKSPNLLVTRADREIADAVKEVAPEAEYFPLSGAVRI